MRAVGNKNSKPPSAGDFPRRRLFTFHPAFFDDGQKSTSVCRRLLFLFCRLSAIAFSLFHFSFGAAQDILVVLVRLPLCLLQAALRRAAPGTSLISANEPRPQPQHAPWQLAAEIFNCRHHHHLAAKRPSQPQQQQASGCCCSPTTLFGSTTRASIGKHRSYRTACESVPHIPRNHGRKSESLPHCSCCGCRSWPDVPWVPAGGPKAASLELAKGPFIQPNLSQPLLRQQHANEGPSASPPAPPRDSCGHRERERRTAQAGTPPAAQVDGTHQERD